MPAGPPTTHFFIGHSLSGGADPRRAIGMFAVLNWDCSYKGKVVAPTKKRTVCHARACQGVDLLPPFSPRWHHRKSTGGRSRARLWNPKSSGLPRCPASRSACCCRFDLCLQTQEGAHVKVIKVAHTAIPRTAVK